MITKIDHLVLNIDEKYQTISEYINEIKRSTIPYLPNKGKRNRGFRASNLWIGKEYFEMISILNQDGGGWIEDWVEAYHQNQRGLICLMLSVDDIDKISKNLARFRVSEPARISYTFLKLFTLRSPWQNSYLPFFENEMVQIGFQQVDSQKVQDRMEKRMKPNSNEHGINSIQEIQMHGNWTTNDFEMLSMVFENHNIGEDYFSAILNSNQKIEFIVNKTTRTVVKTSSSKKILTTIENVEIHT